MPPWGRPPGRRRPELDMYPTNAWPPAAFSRFQELGSDDEQGVVLNPKRKSKFVSDELFFNDFGSRFPVDIRSQDEDLAYGDYHGYSLEPEEYDDLVGGIRADDEVMVHRIMEKSSRAKAKGRANISLSTEEIDALERWNRPRRRKSSSPELPSNSKRSLNGSPGNSVRSRKKSQKSTSSQQSSKSKRSKSSRHEDDNLIDPPYPSSARPPSYHIPVAGVQPPISYYNPSSSNRRSASSPTRPRSRSDSRSISSTPSRSRDTPPSNTRYPPPSDYLRPSSSHSPIPDHPDDHYGRSRASSAVMPGYPHGVPLDPFAYQIASSPAAPPGGPPPGYPPGRRIASGPPDVAYSNVMRRVPVPNATAAAARGPVSASDSAGGSRAGWRERRSELGREMGEESEETSSEDDDEDQGVQVDVQRMNGSGSYEARTTKGNNGWQRRRR
ncbi:hypothetical protein P152DRAFT_471203 [Eremomyces bilateralis CBS 781.70]|uniref:Uncharacterized protein n=1 Tax=Eremomyces bilateralis CBS 781.70 TaxID=1392243 RepID=A0A6G1GCJ7_9PEZI|nr:uncharacterized protein P152DRAFT_471203 [Eremomyces bilateralis CBS 781.70]KAF1815815.1 hypothetical protein P152DRAFT_471203 [Eremomyces bilateralis CBS 781.70]